MEFFITGLKPEIQGDVLQGKPQDIEEAMDLVVLIEEKINKFQGGISITRDSSKAMQNTSITTIREVLNFSGKIISQRQQPHPNFKLKTT